MDFINRMPQFLRHYATYAKIPANAKSPTKN